VQDVMRHASLATTQAYLEVNNEERRTAINLLD
jgi:site-specific recombinase XerD